MGFRVSLAEFGKPQIWSKQSFMDLELVRIPQTGKVLVTPASVFNDENTPALDLDETKRNQNTALVLRVFFRELNKTVYAGAIYHVAEGMLINRVQPNRIEARLVHDNIAGPTTCRVFCPGEEPVLGPCVDCRDGGGWVKVCC